jgi:hypothetical protein
LKTDDLAWGLPFDTCHCGRGEAQQLRDPFIKRGEGNCLAFGPKDLLDLLLKIQSPLTGPGGGLSGVGSRFGGRELPLNACRLRRGQARLIRGTSRERCDPLHWHFAHAHLLIPHLTILGLFTSIGGGLGNTGWRMDSTMTERAARA